MQWRRTTWWQERRCEAADARYMRKCVTRSRDRTVSQAILLDLQVLPTTSNDAC